MPPRSRSRRCAACAWQFLRALTLLAVVAIPAVAAAQRGSVAVANREADPRVAATLEVAGKPVPANRVALGAGVDLVVRFSWNGTAEAMTSATLARPEASGLALAQSAAGDLTGDIAGGAIDGDRWVVTWRVPLTARTAGAAVVGEVAVRYLLAGTDRELSLTAPGPTLAILAPPSKWPTRILWGTVALVILGGGGFWLWRLRGRVVVLQTSIRAGNPHFSSDDPTPYERIHAELATCEMKAQIEDFEAFFAKFRPLLYTFVAVTEGPGVRTLSPDAIAQHFADVGYDPKIGAKVVEFMKTCERYETSHDEPTLKECTQMVKTVRLMANSCMGRHPRGV